MFIHTFFLYMGGVERVKEVTRKKNAAKRALHSARRHRHPQTLKLVILNVHLQTGEDELWTCQMKPGLSNSNTLEL